MIPVRGENYKLEFYRLKENSAYEWEDAPFCVCYGKPANQLEIKSYRVQKGVNNSSDATYLQVTNLPDNVKDGDRVTFMGKIWKVETVGYFFDSNLIVNPRIMNEEYIAKRCPKGVSIH